MYDHRSISLQMLKLAYAPPLILLFMAACLYVADVNESYDTGDFPKTKHHRKKSPTRKDWNKINKCIARSAKILNDEAMKTYRLIDWDNITPEQSDERGKLLSRLNVEKIDRDKECRENGSF